MLASKVGEANGKENKNITPALKIAKQNNIRFRILACISLCDKIFSQVRNDAFNIKDEKNKSSDFFGKTEFLTNTKYKNTENLENFYNKIKFEHLIDINEKNFEDIFIKINVLRDWLVHHILDDDEDIKFNIERNKFYKANFNFKNDLIDENILKNLLENLEGGLFKILPHDLCNEIYHQLWDCILLLNGNPKVGKKLKFKNSKFKKNLDKIKKDKKDFITKINSKLQKDNELLKEINQLKFIFKNKQKNKSNNSASRKSKHKNQGKLTIDATNYVFIGKENYDILKKQIMIHYQIKDIKIDEEKKPKKSAEFINKYNQKAQQDHQKSFEEINKIYFFALEINILFRIYFTDKFNELNDNHDKINQQYNQIHNISSKQRSNQQWQDYNILGTYREILKNNDFKNLRNNIDHSNILQILLSQDKQNLSIAENFSNNLQIAIDFIEKYHHQNLDKIAKEFLNRLYQLFTKNDYLFLRFSDENGNFQKIDIRINKNNKDDANLENNNSKKVQANLENNCSKNSKPRSKVHKIINKKIKEIIKHKQIDKKKLKLIKFHYYSSLKTSLIFDAHRQVLKKINAKN